MKRSILVLISILVIILSSVAQKSDNGDNPTISEKAKNFTSSKGFINYYLDESGSKIYLEISQMDMEFLMVSYLSKGMGSNDVGLDRGKIGAEKIVAFQRIGNKVLLIEPNYRFRAESDDELERKAVEESFARSVLWGFDVKAEENGKVLIDFTAMLISDQNQVEESMNWNGQGTYKVDASRSAVNAERTRNFPDNTEFDAILTFTGQPKGRYVHQVVPTPEHMTLGQHISFVKLPELGEYQPRLFTPGSGYGSMEYMDLAQPLGEPLTKRFIHRHRLEKKDPLAEVSEAVDPIIYYLDPGTPEPMRTALLEGASWWSEAFESIGYKDAYQVKLLPADADPLDIRYNVIQWVHRSTRGWSYGSSVTDPRTGEILKGHVSLGSQRVRQDYMIAEALLSPYGGSPSGVTPSGETVSGEALSGENPTLGKPSGSSPSGDEVKVPSEMERMSLARLRQLSAHEVGHTLGFAHNYIASADGRASVMDYPHPLITLRDGEVDLSDAYDVGIGAWDKVYVAYGYQDFPKSIDEVDGLKTILSDARKEGLRFLSDQDARPEGSSHPATHLWDNGENACLELERIIELRMAVLDKFSEKAIREDVPFSELEDVLVPAYMLHRYQLEAAVKSIGGVEYNYALKGEELQLAMVSPEAQRACMENVMETLAPEFLAVPKSILKKIPPKPMGYRRDRENFKSRTGLTFDPLSVAEVAADHTLKLLLHPQRASRMVSNHAVDPLQPELQVLIDKIVFNTWQTIYDDPYLGEIQRTTDNLVLNHLMQLASDLSAATQVRAIVMYKIDELSLWIEGQLEYIRDSQLEPHYSYALKQISYFKDHPDEFEHETPLDAPPGQPIGDCGLNYMNTDGLPF